MMGPVKNLEILRRRVGYCKLFEVNKFPPFLLLNQRFQFMMQNLCIPDRRMVLAHHPDKKSHKSTKNVIPGLNEHEYFTCITKAYEVLSNVTSRRAYDSVNSPFDDNVPTQVKGDFFETFRLPFKRNARYFLFSV